MPQRLDPSQPQPLHASAATRRIEQAAAAQLPPHTLMQRAGLATARLALALAPHARTVWLACGPGNNGGDGLEAALHLQRWGLNPVVTWLGSPDSAPPDAHASWQRAVDAGVRFADAPPEGLTPQDLCIDALLGIGAARAPAGRMADWLRRLRASPAPLLAIDLPSGLDADTGVLRAPDEDSIAIQNIAEPLTSTSASGPKGIKTTSADRHTLSLLTLKPGLFTAQGRDASGQVWFDDLGVPADAPPTAWLSGLPALPQRPHTSHKGAFGDVAVIGGERLTDAGTAMAGAALLAARAALHGGAGRVYVSLLGDGGGLDVDPAQAELMFRRPAALALQALTVVCGCGGGESVAPLLPDVLARAPRLVLDADALNALAALGGQSLIEALRQRHAQSQASVLTPHPLEAARLLGIGTAQVQADRLGAAQALAERCQAVVVLKGSGTVIAAPGAVPHINPTGNARLATAGTGDVLAGLIGARLAAGQPAFRAACEAAYLHGAVADTWPGPGALTADALARALHA